MKVAILHGEVLPSASPDEQDVLEQVAVVAQALALLGHTPVPVPLSFDLRAAAEQLRTLQPACVFNLVESIQAQGQYIHLGPMLLETLHLPYTGADMTAMFITSNKLLAKQLLSAAGIATPAWYCPAPGQSEAVPFAAPYIVKSVWEHGSIGIDETAVVTTPEQLHTTLQQRRRVYGGEWFVEQYIVGREFNLSLLANGPAGPEFLPPVEMEFVDYPADKPHMVCYRAKWDETSFEYQHTRRRFAFLPEDDALLTRLASIAIRCWQHFNLRGYARVDIRVDHHGTPWVLEVNANPCLAPGGGFGATTDQAGYTMPQVIARILSDLHGVPKRQPEISQPVG